MLSNKQIKRNVYSDDPSVLYTCSEYSYPQPDLLLQDFRRIIHSGGFLSKINGFRTVRDFQRMLVTDFSILPGFEDFDINRVDIKDVFSSGLVKRFNDCCIRFVTNCVEKITFLQKLSTNYYLAVVENLQTTSAQIRLILQTEDGIYFVLPCQDDLGRSNTSNVDSFPYFSLAEQKLTINGSIDPILKDFKIEVTISVNPTGLLIKTTDPEPDNFEEHV